jgi:hypothetical protein
MVEAGVVCRYMDKPMGSMARVFPQVGSPGIGLRPSQGDEDPKVKTLVGGWGLAVFEAGFQRTSGCAEEPGVSLKCSHYGEVKERGGTGSRQMRLSVYRETPSGRDVRG